MKWGVCVCVCVCLKSSRCAPHLLSSPSALSRLFVTKSFSLHFSVRTFFAFLVEVILNRENRNVTFELSSNKNLKNLNSLTPWTRKRPTQVDGENWSINLGIYNRASGFESKLARSVRWSLCTLGHPHGGPGPPRRERNLCPLPRPSGNVPARARPRVGRQFER